MALGCVSRKAAKIILCVTLPILVLALGMTIAFNSIYAIFLKKEISLREGSLATKMWTDIPLPIYEKLYFFNITNSGSFLNGGKPLSVTQVGPYTYKSQWVKHVTHWNPNNTVSYREVRTYHFVPEMSNGTEDDEIYTLNGPMILAAKIAKSYGFITSELLTLFLIAHSETLVIRKSIKELAYDGYKDPIIEDGKYFKKDMPFKEGKFAWLYGKNATDDGLFNVFTGVDDASKTNIINNWNGNEHLEFWKGDTCNMLNGTNIETGPPINGFQETYTFFQSIFCRSLTFSYTDDQTHYGVLTKRFKPTSNLFANSTENPDNYCYEVSEEHASGVLDISPCQFEAPVFLSFPHFYLADPSYLNVVSGLNPNENEHGSYIDVEPVTGFSVDLMVRFQINLEISQSPYIYQLHYVTKGIFPVFWVELSVKIDQNFADFLKRSVESPKIIAYSILIAAEVICMFFIFLSVYVLSLRKKTEDGDPLIDVSQNDQEYLDREIRDCDNFDQQNSVSKDVKNSKEYFQAGSVNSRDPENGIFNEKVKESEEYIKRDKLTGDDNFTVNNSDIRKDISCNSTSVQTNP